jgi:hypothetical protein
MALVERLMGEELPKIRVRGALTVAGIKTFLNMDAAAAEYDLAVFILAEQRYPGYSTPAKVRAKLGL